MTAVVNEHFHSDIFRIDDNLLIIFYKVRAFDIKEKPRVNQASYSRNGYLGQSASGLYSEDIIFFLKTSTGHCDLHQFFDSSRVWKRLWKKIYQVERTASILKYITCLEYGKEPAGINWKDMIMEGRSRRWAWGRRGVGWRRLDLPMQQLKIFEEWCSGIFITLGLGMLSFSHCMQHMKTACNIQSTKQRFFCLTKQEIRRGTGQSRCSLSRQSSRTKFPCSFLFHQPQLEAFILTFPGCHLQARRKGHSKGKNLFQLTSNTIALMEAPSSRRLCTLMISL